MDTGQKHAGKTGLVIEFFLSKHHSTLPQLFDKRMNSKETLQILRQHKAELIKRYDVNHLSLFGSTARNQARANSDIDILVSFNGAATSSRYFGLQFYLEDLLGHPIDLVTEKALRIELRPYIEKEAIRV